MSKPAHDAGLMRNIAEALVNVAARSPERRGPWVFDEDELQAQAVVARDYLAALPSPGEAEPVAWEEVKQRAKNDCFLCCLAMATGLSYEAATAKWGADFTGMVGAKGLYGRENIRFAFRALGLEFGVDYTSLLGAGDGVPSEFAAPARPMKALLWGRRAIVQVKSKNYEGQSHILYWDGDTIHDPSPLATYTWDEAIPEHVWILRERAAIPSPGEAEPVAWPIDTDDQVEALAKECGINNRRYMTPKDYAIWCKQQRQFARLAAPPSERKVIEATDAMVEAAEIEISAMIFSENYTVRTKDIARVAINAALRASGGT